MRQFSAAILAGGRASRFAGRDKSTLMVGDRTIRERQVTALTAVSDDLMIVGARAPSGEVTNISERGGVDRAHAVPALRHVDDLVPGCGPLGGVHAALSFARHDTVVILACDMPYVTTAFVRFLCSLTDAVDIVVPQSERGRHPLCAVYSRACIDVAAACLAEGRLRMRDLVELMNIRVVTAEEIERFGAPARLLANVNTPDEYATLEPLQGHKP
jgi:molybdopterin-guanine dinucleotide biosynthesis protein A